MEDLGAPKSTLSRGSENSGLLPACYMLNILSTLTNLLSTEEPGGGYRYHHHFTNDKTEEERGPVTYPRSHIECG